MLAINEVVCYDRPMFAVIQTGGKQYIVEPGQKLKIEKLETPEGGSFLFDKVLLAGDEEKVEIGAPYIKNAKVEATLIKQGRRDKVIIFKYRPKARHRVKRGHRQPFSEVRIEKIII